MPLDPCPPNVDAEKGQKKVRYRVSGKKDQITVLGCVNAIGQSIPSMVIFEGKHLNHQRTEGEVPGYGGPGGHASRQWVSHITPISSPLTVVTSPPSVTLMSVPFSLRTVAIPVRNADVRTVQSPFQYTC